LRRPETTEKRLEFKLKLEPQALFPEEENMFNTLFSPKRFAWLALALALLARLIQSDMWAQAREKETGVNVKDNTVERKGGYKFGNVSDNKVEIRRVTGAATAR
jgi:hypothetical protein